MRNIFLLTIIASFIACNKGDDITVGMQGPIADIKVRFVDNQGNWIEGIEKKELKLLVADSEWNILKEQPDPSPQVFYDHPIWWTENVYNYVGNGKEEFVGGEKELLFIKIVTFLSDLRGRRNYINDETYGSYLVLKIDEKTSLNIQLVIHQEIFYSHIGPCIEKFICNGKEYNNIEYFYDSYSGKNVPYQKDEPYDIVIE